MAGNFIPKVVTANDLFEGDVIYRDAAGAWVRALSDAEILRNEQDAKAALAIAEQQFGHVVGPYLADVGDSLHFREAFRAKGPSNYTDHGKQAEWLDV